MTDQELAIYLSRHHLIEGGYEAVEKRKEDGARKIPIEIDGLDLIKIFHESAKVDYIRFETLLCDFHNDLCKVQDDLASLKEEIKQIKEALCKDIQPKVGSYSSELL